MALVDSAIATLTQSIFRRVVADKDKDWAASLKTTAQVCNETVHGSLQDRAPKEAQDDQELQLALRRANSEAMVHNATSGARS